MDSQSLIQQLKSNSDTRVKLGIIDIDGIIRGKIVHRDKVLKSLQEGMGFCDVVFGWDSNDVAYDNSRITGWHTGYPDAIATIDISTFRTIPWQDDIPFFIADFSHTDSHLKEVCPRSLLRNITARAEDMGFLPIFSAEYEWFNFRETPTQLADKHYQQPQPATPGMFGYSLLRIGQLHDFATAVFQQMEAFNVPLEGLHTETGPGVYEAAIKHQHILEAADRAILFKAGVKEIALQHQLMACFMAKWNVNLPGCSGHIHQSLWDTAANKNLFFDKNKKDQCSLTMQHYIAGQLYCLPYILPMLAPTINSYKRLLGGDWAPATISWGVENRTCALRVINHSEGGMRMETRVPGADANPYLAMAACLAAGLYGIEHKLTLDDYPRKQGNAYQQATAEERLPATLMEATDAMKNSPIPALLFGETFTDHFIRTREWEWQQYRKQVTDWELKRYFETN